LRKKTKLKFPSIVGGQIGKIIGEVKAGEKKGPKERTIMFSVLRARPNQTKKNRKPSQLFRLTLKNKD
jgi:hypothetical protein